MGGYVESDPAQAHTAAQKTGGTIHVPGGPAGTKKSGTMNTCVRPVTLASSRQGVLCNHLSSYLQRTGVGVKWQKAKEKRLRTSTPLPGQPRMLVARMKSWPAKRGGQQ